MCMYFAVARVKWGRGRQTQPPPPPGQYSSAISLAGKRLVPNRQKYSRATQKKTMEMAEERFALTRPNPSSICASFNELFTLHWFCFCMGSQRLQDAPVPFFVFIGNVQLATTHSCCRNDLQTSCAFRMTASPLFPHATMSSQLDTLNAPLWQTTIKQTHANKPPSTTGTPSPRFLLRTPKCVPHS